MIKILQVTATIITSAYMAVRNGVILVFGRCDLYVARYQYPPVGRFPGFSDDTSAKYNAHTAQVFGELGYRIDTNRVAFEPFVNLAYVNF
jgi:RecJ-like exonuclease